MGAHRKGPVGRGYMPKGGVAAAQAHNEQFTCAGSACDGGCSWPRTDCAAAPMDEVPAVEPVSPEHLEEVWAAGAARQGTPRRLPSILASREYWYGVGSLFGASVLVDVIGLLVR